MQLTGAATSPALAMQSSPSHIIFLFQPSFLLTLAPSGHLSLALDMTPMSGAPDSPSPGCYSCRRVRDPLD